LTGVDTPNSFWLQRHESVLGERDVLVPTGAKPEVELRKTRGESAILLDV
jgi:hypothetical protein